MMARSLAALLTLTALAACGGPGTGPGNTTGGNLTFQIDGGTFTPSSSYAGFDGTSWVVGGANDALQSISISWQGTGTGTFTVGPSSPTIAIYGTGTGAWEAYQNDGSGSVTVTSQTGSRIKGTFSFVLAPSLGSGTKTITSGSFDLAH